MEILVDDEGRAYGTAMEAATAPLVWAFQVVRSSSFAICHPADGRRHRVRVASERSTGQSPANLV